MDALPTECIRRSMGAGKAAGHSYSRYRAGRPLPFLQKIDAIITVVFISG